MSSNPDSNKTAHQDRAVSTTAMTHLHEVGKMCKIDGSLYPSFTGSTVVGDTAASSHIGWSDENMFDVEEVREMVDGIGGKSVGITKKGKRWVTVRTQDGTETNILQDPYKCGPGVDSELFSITAELSQGAKLSSDGRNDMTLTYPDGRVVTFDQRFKTKDG